MTSYTVTTIVVTVYDAESDSYSVTGGNAGFASSIVLGCTHSAHETSCMKTNQSMIRIYEYQRMGTPGAPRRVFRFMCAIRQAYLL